VISRQVKAPAGSEIAANEKKLNSNQIEFSPEIAPLSLI